MYEGGGGVDDEWWLWSELNGGGCWYGLASKGSLGSRIELAAGGSKTPSLCVFAERGEAETGENCSPERGELKPESERLVGDVGLEV